MIGETIGNFRIVSRLGRGGMGEVYAGEHESIQTRVAVKILHSDISKNNDHLQRFFNEAKIVSRIKHAGIVKIFDVGFYKDHAYLIMELLEGEPLSARIARAERLSWNDTVDIGRQIASVLDATHRAGVIHRDLKPENIFLVQDHELARGERVKVLDFGISKLSGTMASGSPKTVGTMGTPAYMAPEQWGDSGSVDWRADAYSLGCALFEMACGRPPFEVKTIADACTKHLHAAPPPPRELVAEIPQPLDELILRLLAKDPADRAVSMGQVSRELEAISGGRVYVATEELPYAKRAPSAPSIDTAAKVVTPASASNVTTIGSSAAQLHTTPPRKRSALIGAISAAVLVAGAIVVVMVARGGSPPTTDSPPMSGSPTASSPLPAGSSSTTSSSSTPDAPPPMTDSPPPAGSGAASATGSAATVATDGSPPKRPKPPKKPPPVTNAGSAKPPVTNTGSAKRPDPKAVGSGSDAGFGGRI